MKRNNNLNLELIIDEYSNYVFKIVNNIVGTSLPYQDKEEIVADVFYLFWKNQKNIKSDIKLYIGMIARNCTYDKLRKKKINLELNEDIISKDFTLDNQIILDQILTIRQKINKLSEEEKKIFYLYYSCGYKIKEISKKLNIKTNIVKIRLYRIRKKLREELL